VATGIFALSYAYRFGKGGAVMAIENSKNIIQTLMVMVLDGIIPNVLEFSGMFVGMLGVMVIVLQK
jgi:hypothetical protein